jgi:hypothetical protein
VRQVDNKRQAHSGRVHWHVRPPLGSDTSAQQIISACFGSLLPGVPNARINWAGSIVSSLQVSRMRDKLIPLRLNELLGFR